MNLSGSEPVRVVAAVVGNSFVNGFVLGLVDKSWLLVDDVADVVVELVVVDDADIADIGDSEFVVAAVNCIELYCSQSMKEEVETMVARMGFDVDTYELDEVGTCLVMLVVLF